MISTLHSVWLRPAVLGGFGGMSDRSFLFFAFICSSCAGREAVGEGAGFSSEEVGMGLVCQWWLSANM